MIIRGFEFDDVFKMSAIIDKMEIETDIDKITESIKTAKLENKKDATNLGKEIAVGIGIDLITKIIRRLHKASNEVKELIMALTGKTKEEVGKMGIRDIKQFFSELVKMEDFEDFLSQAGGTE